MTVTLRPATRDDADRLLAWRNDPDAVRFSSTGALVSPEEHRAWIASRLAREQPRLWIGVEDGRSVGQVRLDVEGSVGVVSIAVAPEHRGRGLAAELLQRMTELTAADPDVQRLVAHVNAANAASLRAFERAGFRQSGRDDSGWLELTRTV